MSKFTYKAIKDSGETIEGEVEAASEDAVSQELMAKGYTPTTIRTKDFLSTILEAFNFAGFLKGFRKVKARELIIFFRQMAALFSAGVPLFESLLALEEQFTEPRFKAIISSIKEDVQSGMSFSGSMSKHPYVFSRLVVAMVEAGERAGVLGDSLHKIAAFLEKEKTMKEKIKAALRYPITVIIALAIAFTVTIVVVVPVFSKIFSRGDVKLPLPTLMLMWINTAIVSYWWLVLIVVIILILAFRWYVGTVSGRYNWDLLILKSPIVGILVIKISLARFFEMFSTMLSSGIPLIQGLEITSNTADNEVISKSILKIRERVTSGISLSNAMREHSFFPPTALHMVAIGEKTGSLDNMLVKSAEYFNEEADYAISNLMSLIEPLILLLLAIFVSVLAMGVYLPLASLSTVYIH